MKKKPVTDPDISEEYDFRGGVRGKYAARYAEGTNVVVLDPDVAELFADSESVNRALRALGQIITEQRSKSAALRRRASAKVP